MAQVLVVEDEESLLQSLRYNLTRAGHDVRLCSNGTQALELIRATPPDVLLLDLMLPGMDGLEVCRHVRRETGNPAISRLPILVLTARDEEIDKVVGLEVGADDYLTKPFAMEELLARTHALLRRRDRNFEVTPQLTVGDLTLDLVRHEARRAGRVIELTAKEFALLEYLMRHPGQVLTRTQITDAVWRYDLEALSNVVDIYIHYLRDKIDQGFAHPVIKTVRGVGYKIEA